MSKKATLSFKRGPRPTGLSAVAHPNASTEIKRNRKRVGTISPPTLRGPYVWSVSFMEKREPTEDDPCRFKHIRLKKTTETEQEMRDFITKVWDDINQKYDLYEQED